MHRNVAAARLARLAEAGLLETSFERRTGRTGPGAGRPAKVYRVRSVPESKERGVYEQLVGYLLQALPQRGRAARLRDVGVRLGRELARPGPVAGTSLEEIRLLARRAGILVRVVEANENGAVLATSACPLRPLVRAHPGAAELDRGMWTGLLHSMFPQGLAAEPTCTTEGCLDRSGPCTIRISVSQPRL